MAQDEKPLLVRQHPLAPEQVAEEMGISVKTVYSKKHKIRNRLEEMLGNRRLAA